MAARRLAGLASAAHAALTGETLQDLEAESLLGAVGGGYRGAANASSSGSGAGVPPGGAAERQVAYSRSDPGTDGASPANSPAQDPLPAIVHLNVGGTRYATTPETLRRYPGSHLAYLFSGRASLVRDADGCFCLDRDGEVFRYILNFLRDGSPPLGVGRGVRVALLREATYYGLHDLHELLGGVQEVAGRRVDDPGMQDFVSPDPRSRFYVRLRYGQEYSADWVVSSPRNLPRVEYELHSACLSRSPVEAMNKMCKAGFKPCDDPPRAPRVPDFYTDRWVIHMYTDKLGVRDSLTRQTSMSSGPPSAKRGSTPSGGPSSPSGGHSPGTSQRALSSPSSPTLASASSRYTGYAVPAGHAGYTGGASATSDTARPTGPGPPLPGSLPFQFEQGSAAERRMNIRL